MTTLQKTRILAAGLLLLSAGLFACGPDEDEKSSVKLYINEIMASNSANSTSTDEFSEHDDWFEIYNAGDEEVDLEGYYVSDDQGDYFKKRLGSGLTVPAKGFLILWADNDPDQGNNHLPFKLKASAEAVYLTSPSSKLLSGAEYENAVTDEVFGRYPDGSGDLIPCDTPTMNGKNGSSCGG